jgi:hypothetical protein
MRDRQVREVALINGSARALRLDRLGTTLRTGVHGDVGAGRMPRIGRGCFAS